MVERVIFELLKEKGQTVSFAESCTGGKLSSHFVAVSGISAVFKGAIVSYCYESKIKHLDVSADLLESRGAVNEDVALQMARGVRSQMQTDWGVSVTGEMGPKALDAEVGTVCFAVVGPHKFEKSICEVFSGSRDQLRGQAVSKAFSLFADRLKSFGSL